MRQNMMRTFSHHGLVHWALGRQVTRPGQHSHNQHLIDCLGSGLPGGEEERRAPAPAQITDHCYHYQVSIVYSPGVLESALALQIIFHTSVPVSGSAQACSQASFSKK